MCDRMYEIRGDMHLLHQQMTVRVKKIEALSQTLTDMKHNLWKQKMEFEALDRELAMLDGRYKKCPVVKKEAKAKVNMMNFTAEQILAIAKELGLEINL